MVFLFVSCHFRDICEKEVDEAFLGYLVDLDSKLALMYDVDQGTQEDGLHKCYAVTEIRPFLERLREKVCFSSSYRIYIGGHPHPCIV